MISVVEMLIVGFTVLEEVETMVEVEPSFPVLVLVIIVVLVLCGSVTVLEEVVNEVLGA